MVTLRPGQRIVNIPGIGVTTSRRAVASAAADWWAVAGKTCVAAYQPKGAASLAASYVNLANPGTRNAAPGTAPTLDASGWVFNGSDQYLTTGYVLADGWAAILRISDTANTGTIFGQEWQFIIPKWIGDQSKHDWRYGSTQKWSAPNVTTGVMALCSGTGYIDGNVADTFSPAANWHPTDEAFIGARSAYGSATGFYAGKIQAVVIYSDTLTAGEVATVSAAMAAL